MTPHVLEKDREVKEEVTWKTYDVAEYDRLSASFDDPKTMKWKLIPKPGGQAIKTDDYYTLQACIKQVEGGDAPKEQPIRTTSHVKLQQVPTRVTFTTVLPRMQLPHYARG